MVANWPQTSRNFILASRFWAFTSHFGWLKFSGILVHGKGNHLWKLSHDLALQP